jgi:hypothetical protein
MRAHSSGTPMIPTMIFEIVEKFVHKIAGFSAQVQRSYDEGGSSPGELADYHDGSMALRQLLLLLIRT